MQPFIELFGRSVPTYGMLGVIGFGVACLFILIRCPAFGLSGDDGAYIGVFAMLGAVVGSKMLYILINIPAIAADFSQFPFGEVVNKYLSGGMVFYGGLGGAFAGGAISAHFFKRRFSDFLPVVLPAFAIVACFGRIGCFMTGCCYGCETTSHLFVVFQKSLMAPNGVKLVPVQLYEAFFDLILVVFLVLIGRKMQAKPMAYSACYLLPYGVFRFILEFFRGDAERGVYILSTSQWISIAVVILAIILVCIEQKERRN